jgi:O-antigen/teichoic acid export membrane protein
VGAFPLVLLIATAGLVDFAGLSFEPGLYACGRERAVLRIRMVTTILYIGAMFAAADRFGVLGVAGATLGHSIANFALLGASLKRALLASRSG